MEADHPYIVFKINEGLYCVNSKNISTILQLPDYQTLPEAPPFMTGIFKYRNTIVEMLDIRTLFHIPTLKQAYLAFVRMLDDRKQDHINWVLELERSLKAGEKFTLATDPHKCAFGKWYDAYPFGDDATSFHMRKIEEPHRRLHEAADTAAKCSRDCAFCTKTECVQNVLERVKKESMQQILRLLDETKEVFHATFYHEMVLLLENSGLGIVVDEVLSVENLTEADGWGTLRAFRASPLISGIKKSDRISGLILELDFSAFTQPAHQKTDKALPCLK